MNVYILLDRSGSMSYLWTEAIGSINSYVSKLDAEDYVCMAIFDNESYDIIRDCKVSDWNIVEWTSYAPRGMTPLYDSCGKLMSRAVADNSDKTILVVMTDGHENCSKEYTHASIKSRIKEFEDRKWEVIFLGANFDQVSDVAAGLGLAGSKFTNISAENLRTFTTTTLATSTAMYKSGHDITFTAEDKLKANSKENSSNA